MRHNLINKATRSLFKFICIFVVLLTTSCNKDLYNAPSEESKRTTWLNDTYGDLLIGKWEREQRLDGYITSEQITLMGGGQLFGHVKFLAKVTGETAKPNEDGYTVLCDADVVGSWKLYSKDGEDIMEMHASDLAHSPKPIPYDHLCKFKGTDGKTFTISDSDDESSPFNKLVYKRIQ